MSIERKKRYLFSFGKLLAKTMEKVCDDHVPVVITRQKAAPAVLLSLENYHSLEETVYLLRSPKNTARLVCKVKDDTISIAQRRQVLIIKPFVLLFVNFLFFWQEFFCRILETFF